MRREIIDCSTNNVGDCLFIMSHLALTKQWITNIYVKFIKHVLVMTFEMADIYFDLNVKMVWNLLEVDPFLGHAFSEEIMVMIFIKLSMCLSIN